MNTFRPFDDWGRLDREEHLADAHGWDERDAQKYPDDELASYHQGEHQLGEFPFGETHDHSGAKEE